MPHGPYFKSGDFVRVSPAYTQNGYARDEWTDRLMVIVEVAPTVGDCLLADPAAPSEGVVWITVHRLTPARCYACGETVTSTRYDDGALCSRDCARFVGEWQDSFEAMSREREPF